MVEQEYSLDAIFGSFSDPTRRDMLQRITEHSMSIGSIAEHYTLSFAGVAKHLEVLARAGLIRKTRHGKEQIVAVDPAAFAAANDYLEHYRQLWDQRLDSLDTYLQSINQKGDHHD